MRKRSGHIKGTVAKSPSPLFCTKPVAAAVCLTLHGLPQPVFAQGESPAALEKIVVTASRREQAIEDVPYNLSVISGTDLARADVTDIASLTRQVPGLSIYDFGDRTNAANVPIIRGINATNASPRSAFRAFEQSPVAVYIGNSPIEGYFDLDDIQRIEVLRGPQGTLYGAGTLGGAIRVIPNSPELGEVSGQLTASAGALAHSSDVAYTASGVLNVPIGETAAVRVSGKYSYEPGFIDVHGILDRTGSSLFGAPVLADPADPVDSPGVFRDADDWNDQKTFTGRASILWEPVDTLSAELAFTYSKLDGTGGPVANADFSGGPYFLDPRITFPPGGEFEFFTASDQPYSRETMLASLDLSYDVGFATLSSTSSYHQTEGTSLFESTYGIGGNSFFQSYYAGNPLNPRFVYMSQFEDSADAFTQEVRLVSNSDPQKRWDYVLGAFYTNQERIGDWHITSPGSHERAVAQGCTAPYFFGASFPNCLPMVGPNDTNFIQVDTQDFEEVSVFGELTRHFTDRAQVTFGGRYYDQDFTDRQSYDLFTFGLFAAGDPIDAPNSGTLGKVNASYEYTDSHRLYATWSQGFRRGGANSFPLEGVAQESPLLLTYEPDEADNYEFGLKGRFANNSSYSMAVFYIDWKNPQIAGSLPSGNLAVFNAKEAVSKGFEFELSGPLFIEDLSYSLGFTYVDATLTEDVALPGNNGVGTIVPGLIRITDGESLPGTPDFSVAGTVTYNRNLVPGYDLSVSLNGTYSSSAPLFRVEGSAKTEAYEILNLSAALTHDPWTLIAYVTNLTDTSADIFPVSVSSFVDLATGGLVRSHITNRPREIGLRISYSF